MSSKIRVLLLLHELTLTGAPKIALDAFETLADRIEVRILAERGGPLADRCQTLGPLRLLSDLPTARFPLTYQMRRFPRRLWVEEIKRFAPQVIYANSIASLNTVSEFGMGWAPGLLHVHELETAITYFAQRHPDFLLERLQNWPRRYIACADAVQQTLTERFGVPVEKITTIHEFIRDQDFRAPLSVGRRDDRFVVGGAGSVEWRKGDTQWLQMAAELTRILGKQNVRFVWVGVPETDNGLFFRATARKLGLADSIDFVAPTREPFPHFASFDVFAMTSWEDPCPIVVLETMMLEKPVVCFAGSGGAPEEIGDTGAIVPDFSPLRMAEAIAALAADPAERERKGKMARERVRTRFTASVLAPRIFDEIRRLSVSSAATR